MQRSISLVAWAWVIACGGSPPTLGGLSSTGSSGDSSEGDPSGASETTSPTSSSTTSEQTESSTETTSPAATTEGDAESSESGEIDTCVVEQPGECSTYLQNCAPGFKCVPWDVDVDNWYDETRCVSAEGSSVEAYQSCRMHDGLDDCVSGTFCADIDGSNSTGSCYPLCGCDENANVGTCALRETTCAVTFGVVVPLCRLRCDPLLQDCGESSGCYHMDDDEFVCIRSFGGSPGGECNVSSYCSAGHECVPGNLGGCSFSTCCTPYCDLTDPVDACPDETQCTSLWDRGAAPPGFEDVGLCML